MNDLQVRIADWHKDNADLRRIRESVFIQEQGVTPEQEWDSDDASATHFLACSFICSILSFQKVLSPAAVWQMYCGFTAILFHRYIPFAAVRSKMLQIAIIILFFPMNCKPIL